MTTTVKSGHLFPSLLAKPLSLVPERLHATLVSKMLNQLLAEQITDGDLEFMTGRCLRIEVMDTGVRFDLGFDGERLLAAGNRKSPDLIFRGNLYDFLLLITRREDSDTLFFQRRLKIEGDTEMGLAIKNFLDAIEIESLPYHRQVDGFLSRAVNLYERIT
ncbi:MAG: sterol-binding protein [Gammaproteobacteria bacterium]|nr:sterol-binding protein [Gammaproteobacteria bacterium]